MDSLLLRQHLELEEHHWWFVSRRRILLSVLQRNLTPERQFEVLDAGCGGGATMDSVRCYGRVRGLEISKAALQHNREQGREVILGSVEQIPFTGDSFDLALALDVIAHVQDDLKALEELFRILRPGGSLLVTVPALRMLWSAHDAANGHYRRYALGELRQRIEAAGFEIVEATYFNTLLFPAVLAIRVLGRLRSKSSTSDVAEVPQPLNTLLEKVFSLEARVVGRVRLPFGVSGLCFARKPGRTDSYKHA
jgi:SAM-dependent methyltransferase